MNTKETLSRISSDELIDYILDLESYAKNLDKQLDNTIGPLLVDQQFMDHVTSIYPDDCYVPYKFIIDKARLEIIALTKMRYDAAMSGAMRWTWSQEAAIVSTQHKPIMFKYV